jgi:hypothetical protein
MTDIGIDQRQQRPRSFERIHAATDAQADTGAPACGAVDLRHVEQVDAERGQARSHRLYLARRERAEVHHQQVLQRRPRKAVESGQQGVGLGGRSECGQQQVAALRQRSRSRRPGSAGR